MKKLYTIIALFSISFLSAQTLFFSEYAEGSSNNKYLEIYNPTNAEIDLSTYAFPSVANAPAVAGEYEYWNEFPAGATIAVGGVYVITHGSADPAILNYSNHTHTYLSNGNDGYKLVEGGTWNDADNDGKKDAGEVTGFSVIDVIGDWQADPGSGWEVAGVTNATKDHTLVRKLSVTTGNADWDDSRGTDSDDSEWVVLDNETWTFLGSHPHTDASLSIFDFGDIKIDVYPNPVQTKLNFSGLTSPVQATVFDMLGKRQLESKVTNTLDVSSLKSGLYMVEIKNENSAKVFNILKK
jgi:predicted extracellular nuclease